MAKARIAAALIAGCLICGSWAVPVQAAPNAADILVGSAADNNIALVE